MTDRADTLVVIPTYCESENIETLVPAVLDALPCGVLVVDDDSPDGTAALVEKSFGGDPRVSLLVRRGKPRGLGPAYLEGFQLALKRKVRFVIQMDADFSHDPAALPRLREAAESADLVIGSRYVQGGATGDWGMLRRLISRGGSWYARTVLTLPVRDVTGGFKCWRVGALATLDLGRIASTGFAFQIEMNHRAHQLGLRIVEIPIRFSDRERGKSKMSWKIFIEGLSAVWRIRFSRKR
jgi:dolichol-phosphate mannosyltransferase